MNWAKSVVATAGIITALAGNAAALVCPAGEVTPDGFTTITLSTVEFKYKIGVGQTELILKKMTPLSGETETQRETVFFDLGPAKSTDGTSGVPNAAIIQTNEYSFDQETLQIVGKVGSAMGAVYYPNGDVDVGYGSEEGGFVARFNSGTGIIDCLPYPENALFGDWTRAISVFDISIADVNAAFNDLKGDLAVCEAARTQLTNENNALKVENAALKAEIARLNGLLQSANAANSRVVYDMRRLMKSLYKEAEKSLKRENSSDLRRQLNRARKFLTQLSRGNHRNVNGLPGNRVLRSGSDKL